jgi:hypothetical protein
MITGPTSRLWSLARNSVARLRSSWTPPVSRRLTVVLAVWPVLLFSFFLIPAVGYLNVPPLFASSNKAEQAAGSQQVRALAVVALSLEGDSTEDTDPAQADRTDQLRQRVGTNILAAAGYLTEAYYVLGEGYPAHNYYVLKPDGRAAVCATPDVPFPQDLTSDRAANIALAIVAVEKFNRNTIQRFAERSYASLHHLAFGQIPDLSFGPAQIRLSLLRQIAATRPDWPEAASWVSLSDDQLLDRLWEECGALKIAATVVVHQSVRLSQLSESHFATTADIAASYAGQRRRSAAPIDYANIVEAMVSMMETQLPDKPAAAPPAAPASPVPSPTEPPAPQSDATTAGHSPPAAPPVQSEEK